LRKFPVEAFLADCDFLSRLIESQNAIGLVLTSFRGYGIHDAAIWVAFGEVKDLDDREWLAIWEVLNIVHTRMYRLKHAGKEH